MDCEYTTYSWFMKLMLLSPPPISENNTSIWIGWTSFWFNAMCTTPVLVQYCFMKLYYRRHHHMCFCVKVCSNSRTGLSDTRWFLKHVSEIWNVEFPYSRVPPGPCVATWMWRILDRKKNRQTANKKLATWRKRRRSTFTTIEIDQIIKSK